MAKYRRREPLRGAWPRWGIKSDSPSYADTSYIEDAFGQWRFNLHCGCLEKGAALSLTPWSWMFPRAAEAKSKLREISTRPCGCFYDGYAGTDSARGGIYQDYAEGRQPEVLSPPAGNRSTSVRACQGLAPFLMSRLSKLSRPIDSAVFERQCSDGGTVRKSVFPIARLGSK